MPLPKPTPTEDEAKFIDRCMSDAKMNEEFPSEMQRYAVCISQFENTKQAQYLAQETFTDYPQAATTNAKRALKWREETGNPRGCGTPVGWARANQLANREPISFETIKRMAAFQRFRRFAGKSYEEGCGTIMWDAWGGTEGIDYAIRKVKEIEG